MGNYSTKSLCPVCNFSLSTKRILGDASFPSREGKLFLFCNSAMKEVEYNFLLYLKVVGASVTYETGAWPLLQCMSSFLVVIERDCPARWIWLKVVSIDRTFLKGTVARDCRPLVFFSIIG